MRRLAPEKPGDPTYRQIWRVVDGAVKSALDAHPEFLAPRARTRTVRNSIVKRVTGAIHGYSLQSEWVRSGCSPADMLAQGPLSPEPGDAGSHGASTSASCCTGREAGGVVASPAAPSA